MPTLSFKVELDRLDRILSGSETFFPELEELKSKLPRNVQGGREFKAVVSLRNARNSFNHYYNIAKFKKNLGVVSNELKSYNKDYTEIVGSAVALQVNQIRESTATAIKSLREDTFKGELEAKKNGNVEAKQWTAERIEEMLRLQLSAKEDLYRVAQAVDEYLQKFTDNVAATPDVECCWCIQ